MSQKALHAILNMDSCLLADAEEIAKGAIHDMPLADRVMKDARGKPCIRCGVQDGTTCGRHYNGQYQHKYGKGRGIKCHPFLVADLCQSCDRVFQEGSVPKSDFAARNDYSDQFQHWCFMSLIRREQEGFFD